MLDGLHISLCVSYLMFSMRKWWPMLVLLIKLINITQKDFIRKLFLVESATGLFAPSVALMETEGCLLKCTISWILEKAYNHGPTTTMKIQKSSPTPPGFPVESAAGLFSPSVVFPCQRVVEMESHSM